MDENQSTTNIDRKTEYRDLLDIIENLNDNESSSNTEPTARINEILRRVNILFKTANSNTKETVKHPDEVLLDAKIIATASDILLNVTDSIDCQLDVYDPADFGRRIRAKLINDEVDEDSDAYYKNLIEAMQGLYTTVPKYYTFYGCIGNPTAEPPTVKERKIRSKQKQEHAPKKAPEKIMDTSKEEDSVDETVQFLQWALTTEFEDSGNKPLNYFHFLIDPNCFTTSVQNMFHFSFLIRDGKVKMNTDANGNLIISPITANDAKKTKKGDVDYKQYIVSIDAMQWAEIIEDKKIENYFLKKRKKIWDAKKQKKSK